MAALECYSGTDPDYVGLLDLIERGNPAWHKDARCKEAPADVDFFPARGAGWRTAKDWCGPCLVRGECFRWSMEQPDELQGIFGGYSQADRRRIRAATTAQRASPGGSPRPRSHPLFKIG